MFRPDDSMPSRSRAWALCLAPILAIVGCSGTSVDSPSPPAASAESPAATKTTTAKGSQPGGADYSGKGIGKTAVEGR